MLPELDESSIESFIHLAVGLLMPGGSIVGDETRITWDWYASSSEASET
jgi:hypothetical protein